MPLIHRLSDTPERGKPVHQHQRYAKDLSVRGSAKSTAAKTPISLPPMRPAVSSSHVFAHCKNLQTYHLAHIGPRVSRVLTGNAMCLSPCPPGDDPFSLFAAYPLPRSRLMGYQWDRIAVG